MPESRPGATVQLAATTAGGHASAHVPVQVLLASVSLVNVYSVRPSGPTRIWPSGEVAAFTETEAPAAAAGAGAGEVAADGGGGAGAAAEGFELSLLPQAANRAPAAASPTRIRVLIMGGAPWWWG